MPLIAKGLRARATFEAKTGGGNGAQGVFLTRFFQIRAGVYRWDGTLNNLDIANEHGGQQFAQGPLAFEERHRVCRWRDGKLVPRWAAAALLTTEQNFRKIMACRDL